MVIWRAMLARYAQQTSYLHQIKYPLHLIRYADIVNMTIRGHVLSTALPPQRPAIRHQGYITLHYDTRSLTNGRSHRFSLTGKKSLRRGTFFPFLLAKREGVLFYIDMYPGTPTKTKVDGPRHRQPALTTVKSVLVACASASVQERNG